MAIYTYPYLLRLSCPISFSFFPPEPPPPPSLEKVTAAVVSDAVSHLHKGIYGNCGKPIPIQSAIWRFSHTKLIRSLTHTRRALTHTSRRPITMSVGQRCRTVCDNVFLVSDPSTVNVISSASTLTESVSHLSENLKNDLPLSVSTCRLRTCGHPSKYCPSEKLFDLGDRLAPDAWHTWKAVGWRRKYLTLNST